MIFESNPTGCWLFCFAHPDDELAIAAWMRHVCRSKADVFAVWAHSLPHRAAESRAVANDIGIKPENLIFLEGKDGTICHQIEELLPIYQALMDQIRPDHVVTCTYEQGHLDHDATNFLVRHTSPVPVWEFPLYHAYDRWYQNMGRFSTEAHAVARPLNQEEIQFKKGIAKKYPSQRIWKILFWYEVLHRVTFRTSHISAAEYLRPAPNVDWFKPNHPHRLTQRVLGSEKWTHWVLAMEDLEKKHPGLVSGSPVSAVPNQAGSVLSQ